MRAIGMLLAASAVMLAPRLAHAQIVNVLNKVHDDTPDGISTEITGSFDWRSGNVDKLDVAGSGTAIYNFGRHLVMISGSAELALKNDERFINKDLEHLRYRLDIVGPLQGELFVQHDRNEFRRRNTRVVFGGGPRLLIPVPEPLDMALGLAYMPELEELSTGDFTDSGVSRWHHRLSGYLHASIDATDRVFIDYTLFGQPALDQITNARILSDLGFEFKIYKPLSLRLSWTLQIDTEPPDSILQSDSVRKATIKLNF